MRTSAKINRMGVTPVDEGKGKRMMDEFKSKKMAPILTKKSPILSGGAVKRAKQGDGLFYTLDERGDVELTEADLEKIPVERIKRSDAGKGKAFKRFEILKLSIKSSIFSGDVNSGQ